MYILTKSRRIDSVVRIIRNIIYFFKDVHNNMYIMSKGTVFRIGIKVLNASP